MHIYSQFWWLVIEDTKNHYCDFTWVPQFLKSLATRLIVQLLVQANNTKTSKLHNTGLVQVSGWVIKFNGLS